MDETGRVTRSGVGNLRPATVSFERMTEILEVKVTWGTQVLAVHHLAAGTRFTFGDTDVDLTAGMRTSYAAEGVTIDVASVGASEKVGRGLFGWFATGTAAAIALSFVGHLTAVATMASFAPPPKEDGISREQLLAMQVLLERAAERDDAEAALETETPGAGSRNVLDDTFAHERPRWDPPHYEEGPKVHEGEVSSTGKLPTEVIQRIVRQSFERFRTCYEAGLRNDPKLEGTVITNLVIGRDGAVKHVIDGGSDLPNEEVAACVVRSFTDLSFPAPEAGIVTASYPIWFEPG